MVSTTHSLSSAVIPDIKALEKRLVKLEQEVDSKAIKVGTVNFNSMQDAEVWLKVHCPKPGSYTFFLDFHSLMALAYEPGLGPRQWNSWTVL